MPEGDTIFRAAATLRAAIVGKEIVAFELRRDPRGRRPPEPDTTVTAVEARGKHLLVHFDDGNVLHTHMQMTGAWHVYRRGDRWRRPGHTARVVIEVDDGTVVVCFAAPLVELRREDSATRPESPAAGTIAALGPDLCAPDPDLDMALRPGGAALPALSYTDRTPRRPRVSTTSASPSGAPPASPSGPRRLDSLAGMKLSGTGIWAGQLRYGDAGPIAEAAAELDELGYSALWIPDVGGDLLESMETLLGATKRTVIATGILNVWMHEPAVVAARRAGWVDAWRVRALFGLGVSHAPLIDAGNPGRYTKPYARMVEYLDGLDAAEPPLPSADRILAALGPRMLALARDRTAGVHPYLVPPEHSARAREIVGPDALVATEQAVVLETDPAAARAIARNHLAMYLPLPNYWNNLKRLGYDESDLLQGGSDRIVDGIVAWGDIDAIKARVDAHRDAGADHVCIQVLRADYEFPKTEWRELAAGLVEG